MPRRTFKPTGIDALEDRMVLTAFSIPFTIVPAQPASEINPKFLVLTGKTEGQVFGAITADFNRFSHAVGAAESAYAKALTKPKANPTTLLVQLEAKVNQAIDRLTSDLGQVSYKVPFGHQNLFPVLEPRIEGPPRDPLPNSLPPTQSLQATLLSAIEEGNDAAGIQAIASAQTSVRTDVNDDINLGVTNGDFKLGAGATLPALS